MIETLVEVDQATRDELQPPCDAHRALRSTDKQCERPAEWIVHIHPARGAARDPLLLCTGHKREVVTHLRWCPACSQSVHVTTEPLR